MFSNKLKVTASCLALSLTGIPASFAQENTSDQIAETTNVLETIVVTSTKREQSLQDIGLSVTAVTSEEIRDLGINDVEDVIGLIPGTGFNNVAGGGIPVVIIRGVGLQNFRINDTPTTAIYVDEVYQTSIAEAVSTIFDVERVEVLKGPQGGLYGRNAVGGAIQIISAKPNFDEFEGYISAGLEEYGRLETEAVISGPFSDKLAYRIGGKWIESDDKYFHSVPGDFDHGEEDKWAARGQLQFRPNSNTDFLLKVHGGADKSELPLYRAVGMYRRLGLGLSAVTGVTDTGDGAILNAQGATTSINNICDAVLNGGRSNSDCETAGGLSENQHGLVSRYDSLSTSRPALDNTWIGASLIGNFYFGPYTLTSITAYDDFNHGRIIDQDMLAEVHQEIDYETDILAYSQELRLGYDSGGDFSWILGASYAEDELTEDTLLFADTGILRAQIRVPQAQQKYVQTSEAASIYGRSDWTFADKYNLVVEGRYTQETKGFDGGVDLVFPTGALFSLSDVDDSETYDAFAGKVALEYSPTDQSLLYASVSRGFKSGGFFGGFATSNTQLAPFDNETINALEAGFKTEFPEQALRLNGSVFYYDRQDVQANARDPRGLVAVSRLTNIGDVETYGAELETIWAPVDGLSFQGGIAYLKADIVDSELQTSNVFGTSNAESYEGTRLPNQPELTANLRTTYEHPITSDILGKVQLEYSYKSEQDLQIVVNPLESALLTEEAYSLVNLRLSALAENGAWNFSLYATNLFDEKYRESATGAGPAGVVELYGTPRIFGARLGLAF